MLLTLLTQRKLLHECPDEWEPPKQPLNKMLAFSLPHIRKKRNYTHTHICLYFWRIHGRTITKEQHAFAKQTYKFLCVIICRHTWGAVPRTSGYIHHQLKNHIFSVHILIIRKKQWKSPQSPNISPWSGWYYFTKLKFVATNFPQSTNGALLQFTRDFCEAAPQDLRLEDHWRSSE